MTNLFRDKKSSLYRLQIYVVANPELMASEAHFLSNTLLRANDPANSRQDN